MTGRPLPGPQRRGIRAPLIRLVAGLAVAVGLAAASLGLLPLLDTPDPSTTARPPDPASWRERPFRPNSPWNVPIGPQPSIDPSTRQFIARLGGPLTSDPTQYSFTLYVVNAQTPRYDVACTKYQCTRVTTTGTSVTDVLSNVPIPPDAKPSSGADGQMILVDPATGMEYDLWQAERTQVGWQVSNASVYDIRADGAPTEYGSRGAGIPYLAGLIRPWEVSNQKIEHAIAFATDTVAKDRCVFPASKTDGKSGREFALPEGARLQLDPGLTASDLEALGLGATGRVIARALQEYGMILVDGSGRTKIYAENLRDNPYASVSWDADGLALSEQTVTPIPIDRFRVLALPPGYWTDSGPRHGDCHRA
jgi:hypothetical protein